jgi:hypothetical protein
MQKWLEGSYISIVQLRARQAYVLCQGPKTTGLIILEHELTDATAQAFINNYYLIPGNDWKAISAAEMDGENRPYQNAEGTTGAVTYARVVPKENNASL